MSTIPKLKRSTEKAKITLYMDKEVEELYRVGKQNGWDVCEIVRQAATRALRDQAETLRSQAE